MTLHALYASFLFSFLYFSYINLCNLYCDSILAIPLKTLVLLKPQRMNIQLRKTTVEDLETLYLFQLDEQAIHMAAFTSKDHTDRTTYFEKWTRFLQNKTIHAQTILYNGQIAGSVGKYIMEGEAEITYWLNRHFWGKGIATKALQQFLTLETTRPMNGHVAFDNIASQKVLENCGFVKTGSVQYFANARGKEIEEFIYRLV